MQILNKKVDVSKVTSKCGSKDNIKHKPGELGNVVLTLLCLICRIIKCMVLKSCRMVLSLYTEVAVYRCI